MSMQPDSVSDLLARRDRLVADIRASVGAGQIDDAMDMLRQLADVTIDQTTLDLTDPLLPSLTAGRRIVASLDPQRTPAPGELVIVYGNYPHFFGNVVVNNPIRRHVADFWRFHHDVVESDARWNGVDRILVINVERRQDRLDAVLRELALARAPFDRVTRIGAVGPDDTDIERARTTIACLKSHIAALKAAREAGWQHTLILEDDFCFSSDVETHLDDLAAFLTRHYDYWICLIATSKYGATVPYDDLLAVTHQPCTNAAGYLVSREGVATVLAVFEHALERLRETGDTIAWAADRCWATLQPSGRFLVFRRKFGFQAAGYSDIEHAIARYLD